LAQTQFATRLQKLTALYASTQPETTKKMTTNKAGFRAGLLTSLGTGFWDS